MGERVLTKCPVCGKDGVLGTCAACVCVAEVTRRVRAVTEGLKRRMSLSSKPYDEPLAVLIEELEAVFPGAAIKVEPLPPAPESAPPVLTLEQATEALLHEAGVQCDACARSSMQGSNGRAVYTCEHCSVLWATYWACERARTERPTSLCAWFEVLLAAANTECDACAKKPGMPTLCGHCLRLRDALIAYRRAEKEQP